MKPMDKTNTPPHYRQDVTLLDGSQASIRPITPEDKEALLAFFDRLSPETRYLRFHYVKCELSQTELECYCSVDYDNTLGLVAEKVSNGKTVIVGVGRYARMPCEYSAEVAFVVEDKEQNRGIGTHLLRELAKLAWQRGIVNFVAELMADNARMMSIFKKYDPQLQQEAEGSSRQVTFYV